MPLKKTGHSFSPHTRDVCRIDNGNTNPYLVEERAVEEFLDTIEPKYNYSIEKLRYGKIDFECIYSIAGFIAYILTCSPCSVRTHKEWLAKLVEIETIHAEKAGLLPPRPSAIAHTSLSDMFETGVIKVDIDGKYPQALGIASILESIHMYGNYYWEILINEQADSPFFTSDFPVAIETTNDPRVLNRIIPLSPTLALRIRPNLELLDKRADDEISFVNFDYKILKPSREEVRKINSLIVRCAEQFVFFGKNYAWIPKFVERNKNFRLSSVITKIPTRNGTFMHTTLGITKL